MAEFKCNHRVRCFVSRRHSNVSKRRKAVLRAGFKNQGISSSFRCTSALSVCTRYIKLASGLPDSSPLVSTCRHRPRRRSGR